MVQLLAFCLKEPFMKALLVLAFLSFSLLPLGLKAQEKDKNVLKEMVETRRFVFKAQTAYPLSGQMRQLTSDYDLRFAGDSLISFLPYFGRAYSAPINTQEGGIKFTSTDYEYKATSGKKGGWQITIKPKDIRDVRQLNLTISAKGYASLQVSSNDRQSISFNGYVVK